MSLSQALIWKVFLGKRNLEGIQCKYLHLLLNPQTGKVTQAYYLDGLHWLIKPISLEGCIAVLFSHIEVK